MIYWLISIRDDDGDAADDDHDDDDDDAHAVAYRVLANLSSTLIFIIICQLKRALHCIVCARRVEIEQ
jgi:hypothetical protein